MFLQPSYPFIKASYVVGTFLFGQGLVWFIPVSLLPGQCLAHHGLLVNTDEPVDTIHGLLHVQATGTLKPGHILFIVGKKRIHL